MPVRSVVRWFGDKILKRVKTRAQVGVENIAFEIRDRARRNLEQGGHVDTKFLYNSIYVATPTTTSPIPPAGTYTSTKGHGQVRRERGEIATVHRGAFVGAAAPYAVFVEIDDPFLWPAVEEMQGRPAEGLMTGLLAP